MLVRPDRTLAHLHPTMRERVGSVSAQLRRENMPFRLYEGARHPYRQAQLYARGRFGDDRKTVTRARPWDSLHQYGLAADFVAWDGVKWSWPKADDGAWRVLHEIGRQFRLVALSFERPHLQLDIDLADVKAGRLPSGDTSWEDWIFEAAAVGPPPPDVVVHAEAWGWPPAWLTSERPPEDDVTT